MKIVEEIQNILYQIRKKKDFFFEGRGREGGIYYFHLSIIKIFVHHCGTGSNMHACFAEVPGLIPSWDRFPGEVFPHL